MGCSVRVVVPMQAPPLSLHDHPTPSAGLGTIDVFQLIDHAAVAEIIRFAWSQLVVLWIERADLAVLRPFPAGWALALAAVVHFAVGVRTEVAWAGVVAWYASVRVSVAGLKLLVVRVTATDLLCLLCICAAVSSAALGRARRCG